MLVVVRRVCIRKTHLNIDGFVVANVLSPLAATPINRLFASTSREIIASLLLPYDGK